MYKLVGQEYIDMMNSNRGVLSARIVIGETVVESEQIYSVTCESAACPEKLSVGNFVMPKLTASISKEVSLPLVTSGLKVAFYVGMSADGADFEYALVCSAQVASVTQKGQLYEISAHSGISNKINQLYNSELTFPQTSHSVLQEVGNYISVKIDCEGVSDFTIDTQPSGYSCREIIASIAEKSGVNAFVSRDDSTIIFKWFEDTNTVINSDCINEPSLAVDSVCYKGVTCTSGSELLVHGEEPFLPLCNTAKLIVQSGDLVPILNSVSNVTFHPGSISMLLGNILYDPWDIVTVVIDDDTVMLPVCNLSHKYDGGLTTEIRIPEQEKVSSDGSSSSKTTAERAVDRLTAELFSAKQIMADKASVNELSANLADFENATAESFQAQQAKISTLEAEKLNTDELSAEVAKLGYATVVELEAEKGRIDMLDATKLEASSAEIKNLEAGVADINMLIFGSASGDVIQTEFANAVVAQLGDAQIKSAMIESISAGQITAGDIVTNNVRVVSEDGSLLISDETMQISDGSTPRVQIGKDALGDYSLYVWDKDGKLMFDALGVHEAGIKSGIIRDDMVSETANISAGKLNIDSLFSVINEDGSHTLNASKVLLDADAQTLEVAFKSMNSKVTEVDSRVSTMGTELSVVQGQITSKIWEQDITTAIDGVENDITALSTSYSALSQDVSSFRTEVAETYTTNEEFDDAFDVHGTANGSPITISDSADAQLEGLKVYGNSKQDGTPTPDAPVEIESVENPVVTFNEKNLLDTRWLSSAPENYKNRGVTFAPAEDGKTSIKGTTTDTYARVPANYFSNINLPAGTYKFKCFAEGTINDASVCCIIKKDYANTYTAVANKKTIDIEIVEGSLYQVYYCVKETGVTVDCKASAMIVASNVDTSTYAPYKEGQSLSVVTSSSLYGIPVASGGNYTDANGQQWICDEIDFARGVKIRRCGKNVIDESTDISQTFTILGNYARTALAMDDMAITTCGLSNIMTHRAAWTNDSLHFYPERNYIRLFVPVAELSTQDNAGVKEWLINHSAEFLYALATPVETPLTEEEIEAYKSLKTNYPFTTVLVNDGAGMVIDYRRHTKAIDFATTSYTNAAIEQSADEIKQSVSASVEALDGRLATAEASITVNTGNIAQKVSQTDYNGEKIASLINQSASTVTIEASHIKFEGVVTANEGFKIDTDGSMEATAGTIGSFIISDTGIRNSDNTFAIVPATDGNRVIGVGGTPTARNLGIFSDGTVKIGPDSSNRLVLNSGNIDFYYGSSYNGRLGQPFGDSPGFEGCDLYISTNNKYMYGMTAKGSAQRMLGITAAGNMVLSAPTNSANLYMYSSEEMYFYLGSSRLMALDTNGLRFSNGTGVELNNKIAFRYYGSAVYCGADSEPLKLVGSTVTSNGASVTSDARLKNHIAPLDDKYTSLLEVLDPRQYMYNDHNAGTTNVGFIAQEVLTALESVGLTTQDFGGFVDVYGDGREYALDYTQFIPILWAAVQKLIERT